MLQNLTSKTDWKTNYGVSDTSSFIVISTAHREKILYEYDLYTYDYTTYKEIDITEEAITNGILDDIVFFEAIEIFSSLFFKTLFLLTSTFFSEILL